MLIYFSQNVDFTYLDCFQCTALMRLLQFLWLAFYRLKYYIYLNEFGVFYGLNLLCNFPFDLKNENLFKPINLSTDGLIQGTKNSSSGDLA